MLSVVAALALGACSAGGDGSEQAVPLATTVTSAGDVASASVTAAGAPTTVGPGSVVGVAAPATVPLTGPPVTAAALPAAKPVAGTTSVQFVEITALPLAATGTGECTTASAIVRCQVATGVSGPRTFDGVVFDYCFVPFGAAGRAVVRCVVPASLEAVDLSFVESTTLGPVPVAAGDIVRVQLASGVTCAIAPAEWSEIPAAQRVSFNCADGMQLVGPLDESTSPKWTAGLARDGAIVPVPVDTVWKL